MWRGAPETRQAPSGHDRRAAATQAHLRDHFAPATPGKTTLTEKLLLFGGAIQLAGEVKAKAAAAGRARTG
jgi:peptide subunit release factor RF-3